MYKIKQSPEDFYVKELMELRFDDRGRYAYYLLWKRNLNTVDAVERVSRAWRINPRYINFAGAKDRRAVTEQYISVSNGPRKNIDQPDLKLKYLGNGNERINLGTLRGNHFKIKVNSGRKPRPIRQMKNFFDEQRFGMKKNNHIIGKHIIKREFGRAVELIGEQGPREHLNKHPNDYVGALKKIPRKILQIYVHAYQSHLWNEMAKSAGKKQLPLIGYNTEMTPAVRDILEKEGIKPSDFIIRQIPELSSEGAMRDVHAEVKNLKIKENMVEFDLPKGSYATEAVRQMLKE